MKKHASVHSRAALAATGLLIASLANPTLASGDHGAKPAKAAKSDAEAAPPRKNPFAGDAAAAAEGRRLFMANNCYGCHSPAGGGAMGPALIDAKWEHGSKPGDLYKSVAEGHPEHGMPPFGKRLSPDEIWKLVTFVQSIGPAGR